MSVSELTEAPVAQGRARPRALIVTVYGLYAREAGGWLSISSLIRLMSALDVDEPAVRSSISRLKRRGILESEKVDGVAGYALSAEARDILDEGDRRIFGRRRQVRDDGWVLAVFSVPESERQRRHTLRSRLTWLGFGTVSAGVWIAPHHLADETSDVLHRQQLDAFVDLFRADYLGFADLRTEVATWWDLAQLQQLYTEFVAEYAPVLAKWKRRRRSPDEQEAFADYVRALTTWRRLPFLDPGLAPELLPEDWAGGAAADLFFALQERLAGPANGHVQRIRLR